MGGEDEEGFFLGGGGLGDAAVLPRGSTASPSRTELPNRTCASVVLYFLFRTGLGWMG